MQSAIDGPDGKGTLLVDVFNEQQHRIYTAMTSKKPMSAPGFDVLKVALTKTTRLDEPASAITNVSTDQQAVVQPTAQIHTAFLKVFVALDAGLSVVDAEKVKTAIVGIIDDVCRMAESEMEVGIVADSINMPRVPELSYNAGWERRLNADEQKTFTAFMRKPRFTKGDFPALDKFYQGPYDRLSERGKDEMSARIDAGMKPPN